MSSESILIGIDVGTTNIKAIAFTATGQQIAAASESTPTHVSQPGWMHYEPDELWGAVVRLLRQLTSVVEPERIRGIAVASMGEAAVPLDRDNNPLYPMIAWFDPRSKPQVEWLDEVIGKVAIFQTTGLSLLHMFGLCKMLWLKENEPDVFANTVRWLNVADYIAFKLSGQQATDYSLASRTLALNIHKQAWATDILQAANIPVDLFAPLTASGTPLGNVTHEAASQTGLPETAVVSTGGHDHVCAAFAIGATQPGIVLDSMGTAETIFTTMDAPLTDPIVGQQGFTQGMHVVPDKLYIFGTVFSSGGSIEWFRKTFADSLPYETLIEEAQHIDQGSQGTCFLPYLQLTSPPYDNPEARGCFIGLRSETDRATLFRALLEGIAYDARQILDAMLTLGLNADPRVVYAVGGNTRNQLLMKIKATINNKPVHIMKVSEATSLGAAMLAGIGAGVYKDAAEAQATVNIAASEILPDEAAVAQYEAIYKQVYQKLYSTLHPLHNTLIDLTINYKGKTE